MDIKNRLHNGEFLLQFSLHVCYLNTLSIKIYRNIHIILSGILYGVTVRISHLGRNDMLTFSEVTGDR
jgi:hypothetical protein